MAAMYNSSGGRLRYACSRMAVDYGEPHCQSLVGQVLDDWVSTQVLRALEPAALEISLRVAADLEGEGERQHLHHHWRQRLERPATRLNEPLANTRRSNPNIGWWRAPWNGNGRRRWPPRPPCRPTMPASRPSDRRS